ncbi:hypothetical protein [Minwuia sp.]|uniref:hypothetical protein n=1 Tax=Minwuia sp. TaxID=2493630 RepID=UPI003A9487B0
MFRRVLLAAAVVSSGFGAAEAQTRTYNEWQDPAAQQARERQTDQLISELRQILAAGRRDRAADPRYLDDLQRLLDRHEAAERAATAATPPAPQTEPAAPRADITPDRGRWRHVQDDFSDGDFTNNPRWIVAQGEYFITRSGRLSSIVRLNETNSRRNERLDPVAELFGRLLGRPLGDQRQGRDDRVSTEQAAIFLPHRLTNAFDLTATLASDARAGGLLEIGVYQGDDGRNGYRLQFTDQGVVKLVRVGQSVVQLRSAAFTFPARVNNRPGTYAVRWVRSKKGRMHVWVSGTKVFDVTDNAFRDDFHGFRMVNANGRHGLDSVAIKVVNR